MDSIESDFGVANFLFAVRDGFLSDEALEAAGMEDFARDFVGLGWRALSVGDFEEVRTVGAFLALPDLAARALVLADLTFRARLGGGWEEGDAWLAVASDALAESFSWRYRAFPGPWPSHWKEPVNRWPFSHTTRAPSRSNILTMSEPLYVEWVVTNDFKIVGVNVTKAAVRSGNGKQACPFGVMYSEGSA